MLSDTDHTEECRPARKVNVSFSPDALVRLARGFSCIFWGVALTLLLASGTLDIRVVSFVHMPVYVFGVLLAYIGAVFLQRAGALSDAWALYVRLLLLLLLVEVYLAPFVYWWRKMPHALYFNLNVSALILCTAWGMFIVNRLAGEAGALLHDRTFVFETRVAGWLSAAFMLIPLAHALYATIVAAIETNGYVAYTFDPPPWVYVLSVLPFGTTMAVAWKMKERCLQLLKMSAKMPAIPPNAAEI